MRSLCFEVCEDLSEEKRNLLNLVELVDGWQYGEEGAKLAIILEKSCIDQRVGRELKKMLKSWCHSVGCPPTVCPQG